MKKRWMSRLSVLVGFLVGTRIFIALLLIFALYVSAFFLFNQVETLRDFVFDFKVHGIILCTFCCVVAGGIINQFYDKEKDAYQKPFRTRLQSFVAERHYLYFYLALNLFSLGIAGLISLRVLIFFLIYQFFMWFYSHKLSRILILNNLTFVALTLYPFFGMLVYFRTFTVHLLLMSVFLFLLLLTVDVIKDDLTKNTDRVFGYQTLANYFSSGTAKWISAFLLFFNAGISLAIVWQGDAHLPMKDYFWLSVLVFVGLITLLLFKKGKYTSFTTLNVLRIWVFLGILVMLTDGIIAYLHS